MDIPITGRRSCSVNGPSWGTDQNLETCRHRLTIHKLCSLLLPICWVECSCVSSSLPVSMSKDRGLQRLTQGQVQIARLARSATCARSPRTHTSGGRAPDCTLVHQTEWSPRSLDPLSALAALSPAYTAGQRP
jgi:hypothetical protein